MIEDAIDREVEAVDSGESQFVDQLSCQTDVVWLYPSYRSSNLPNVSVLLI